MTAGPNIIVVVSDTLRTAELGCYGSTNVRTPAIDALAGQAMRFTRAHPESLPTIPVRRALHTGRRAYPFHDYRPVKWDIVYLPGWQPVDSDEDTLAENLATAGYHTGLVTDTMPYFASGFNFTRGFLQWEYVRGQQQDRWQSPHAVPDERLARYGDVEELRKDPYGIVPMHLANTAHVKSEEDTSTARTFQWAMRFLEDNKSGQPFYLLVDCFDPHEPWEAPEKYYSMYGDPGYAGRRLVFCHYGPAHELGYSPEEIAYVHSQYCGLVTFVDTWLGRLMRKLEELDLSGNTAVLFMSDHGTNFCENPRNVIGKPCNAMYPGVMHLPCLVRLPGGPGAGQSCDALVYNMDVAATVYELAGVRSEQGVHGQSLVPLVTGKGVWQAREYVTCGYGESLCYIDDETWVLTGLDGKPQEMFDLASDPGCQNNVCAGIAPARFKTAWERLLADAGGSFPDHREWQSRQTDAIGQKPLSGPDPVEGD